MRYRILGAGLLVAASQITAAEITAAEITAAQISAAEVVGWRGDWSGAFRSPQPPTAWTQTEHVAWKSKLPGSSNGSPVAVGDFVFVCAEPTLLLCFDRNDGKLLWKAEHPFDKVLPPAELAAAERDLAAAREIRKQNDGLQKQLDEIHRGLKDSPDDAALIARRDEIRGQIERAREELKPLERYRLPDRAAGCTTPTPASDGRHVFALFGTGIAACYELDGKLVWIRLLERPEVEWGQTASPLLVGRYLLAHTKHLVALDSASGEPVWSAPVAARPGSPVPARVGDVDLVVTAGADVVRLSDGKVLAEKITPGVDRSSPIVVGDVAYFIQAQARAVRLAVDGDRVAATPLWELKLASENYFASPLVVDGLLYTVSENRVLTVIDAAAGDVVYQERLKFKSRGAVVSSLVAAGNYLYVTNEAGSTKVLRLGRTLSEVAENSLQHLRSSLNFDGNRLFVRTQEQLFAIEAAAAASEADRSDAREPADAAAPPATR